ncbi:MAG: hypothetical protein NZ580_03905 [Bacteroidia bacterium]|nr:hypothetical protein [Bacteroidia bacterium]MDW8236232.1 hypothetical protein [Bacteroidia bacterium]
MKVLLLVAGVLVAQQPLLYRQIHYKMVSYVRDTSQQGWLPRLRPVMEEVREVEWHDRFFREIAQLYLSQPDSLSILLHKVKKYVGADSLQLAHVLFPLSDKGVENTTLIAILSEAEQRVTGDTTLTGYLIRQMGGLGRTAAEVWLTLPENPPVAPIVYAALRGYLKGLLAAYTFFGFDASSEPWRQKLYVVERIGLLDYFSYGESANTFRAWRRGKLP